MIILAFFACVFFAMGILIHRPELFITLSILDYHLYMSIFTFIGGLFALLFMWKLICFPFTACRHLKKKLNDRFEQKRLNYLGSVLQEMLNHNKEVYPILVKKASSFFERDQAIYWTILALLQPDEQVYQKLLTFPETTLGGIRGFLNIAEAQGNLEEIHQLLDSLTDKQKQIRWVQHSYWQLYIMENNWTEALNTLEKLRKTMPKKDYIARKATLLLLLGETEQAYKLDPSQASIALAYAKETPKKAVKILQRLWEESPCWEVYAAYKDILQSEDTKYQKKAIYKLVKQNPANRFSLLAKADFALTNQDYKEANETLREYQKSFTLTQQVALMLAKIEREGNNNESNALSWENKAKELQEKSGWACKNCSYTSNKWEPVCPACHLFNTFIPN